MGTKVGLRLYLYLGNEVRQGASGRNGLLK